MGVLVYPQLVCDQQIDPEVIDRHLAPAERVIAREKLAHQTGSLHPKAKRGGH